MLSKALEDGVDQMRRMQDDLDTTLSSVAEEFAASRADDEVGTLAAERIRSGTAERTRDDAEVLAELSIPTH